MEEFSNLADTIISFALNVELEIWRTVFSGLTLVSVFIAYLTLLSTKRKQREEDNRNYDKEIISQAIRSLEWAYDALEVDPETEMPFADRLNWLTSARHILRYYKLRDSLRTETHKTICAEYEEYWRHRFYLLFDNPNFLFGSYFTDYQKQPEYPVNIEIVSAMTLSVFSQWNENAIDPINSAKKQELIEKNAFNGLLGGGIKHYDEILTEAMEKLK